MKSDNLCQSTRMLFLTKDSRFVYTANDICAASRPIWTERSLLFTMSSMQSACEQAIRHLPSSRGDWEHLVQWRIPQGQYWAGRTPPQNNRPKNMAAANFVVITNGEGCALMEQPLPQCLSTNNVPRVAIGCRLPSSMEGPLSVATWYASPWIGGTASEYRIFIQICGGKW